MAKSKKKAKPAAANEQASGPKQYETLPGFEQLIKLTVTKKVKKKKK